MYELDHMVANVFVYRWLNQHEMSHFTITAIIRISFVFTFITFRRTATMAALQLQFYILCQLLYSLLGYTSFYLHASYVSFCLCPHQFCDI